MRTNDPVTARANRAALVNRCLERLDALPPLLGTHPKTRRALAVGAVLEAALDVLVEDARAAADNAETARPRALVHDVVTAAHQGPAPVWMTDDLWARLTAETPNPSGYTRATVAQSGLFEVAS